LSFRRDLGEKWGPRIRALDTGLPGAHRPPALAASVVPTSAWQKRTAELLVPGAGDVLREMLEDAMTRRARRWLGRSRIGDKTFVLAERRWSTRTSSCCAVRSGRRRARRTVGRPAARPLGIHFGTSGGCNNVAREERLASSAANALGAIGSVEAIASLGRMKAKVTNRPVTKQVVKALDSAARAAGVSSGELWSSPSRRQGSGRTAPAPR
jgi:hypothetical protein